MGFFHTLHQRLEIILGERIFHLLRYIISGGTAAATNVAILFLLVHFGGFHYLAASVIAYLLAIFVSFTLQKFWTFQDRPTHDMHSQFARYISIVFGNLLLNTALLYILVEQLGLWYIFGQILATATVAVVGYFAYRRFVFTERVT